MGHNSRVRLNEAHGNGYSEPSDDFGIGIVATASGNLIEENAVMGNTNGIYLAANTRDTTVRQNTAVGNPGIQVGNSQLSSRAVDILNLAPTGANRFERNVCITSVNAPCPDTSQASGWRPREQP
jgi:parallel beta-helix repeat protein